MANPEHVELVKRGAHEIAEWRQMNPSVALDLRRADLRRLELDGADLSMANLSEVILNGAILSHVTLRNANLALADLSSAKLRWADLRFADLSGADLRGVDLRSADLAIASLDRAELAGADLSDACADRTRFGGIDLSATNGLAEIRHLGPSTIGIDTLVASQGRIPEAFLVGCGVPKWMVDVANLCDPALSPNEVSELISTKLFDSRTHGPLFIGGAFISYSHANKKFVDKLFKRLQQAGASVWLDRHDMIAGPMERQVMGAIRLKDAVVLVLSEAALQSDWVWHEIQTARNKEKEQGRNVLCPISLDDSWHKPDSIADDMTRNKVRYMLDSHCIEMDFIKQKLVLDFSNERHFSKQFEKLLRGMKIYYTPGQ